MLPCMFSVTLVDHKKVPHELCRWCSYLILMSSVIYYWTDTWQHRIYLFYFNSYQRRHLCIYITKTESNNSVIIHCFEENNDKRIIAAITVYFQTLKNVQRIEKRFLLRCLRTWHCCPCTWHCSWKSCIARATYRLFTKYRLVNNL